MRPILWITALALLGVALGAQAGQHQKTTTARYRWVDATGLPHFSDSLSIKALQYGYEVLGPNGHVVRHVRGTLTPAQRKADAIRLAKQQTAIDQRRHDRQLLMAYPTAADYKAAQQARIDQLHGHLHTTRLNLTSQEQNLAQLLASAAGYNRHGKAIPPALEKRISSQRQAVGAQRQLLKQRQAQLARVKQQVAGKLAHFRTLLAEQKTRGKR